MLGLGLGLTKGGFIPNFAKTIYKQYVARVTAAGGVFQNAVCALNRLLGLNSQSLLKQASLVLIPDGIKEDVVFSQVPTTGAGDFAFARASDATYTDSTGVIRRSPYNLLTWSEMFTDANWAKPAITVTANTTTAPNGTLTADTISIGVDGSPQRHRVYQSNTLTIGTTYTGTYYLKKQDQDWIQIVAVSGFSANVWANFNLANGTIGNTGGVDTTASIEDVGNGWYRCRVSGVATGTSSTGFEILVINNTNGIRYPSYQSTQAANVCYVWGAQLVEGTSALDYFPTTNRQDVPRIDFRNADGTLSSCGMLEAEQQRTNLLLQSNTFTTTWIKYEGPAVTPNSITSPDGSVNATTLNSGGTANDFLYQVISGLTLGATYTLSFYIKNNNSSASRFWGPLQSSPVIDINWSGATLSSIVGTGSSFTSVGNGWYRVVATGALSTTSPIIRIFADINNTSKSVYIYGAQFEAGSFVSTYIPTTAATVTRIKDDVSISGASALIGQTQGTIFIDVDFRVVSSGGIRAFFCLEGSVTNQFTGFAIGTSNNGNDVQAAGTIYALTQGRHKIVFRYNSTTNVSKLFVDGAQRGASTSAAFASTVDRISVLGRVNPFSSFQVDRQQFGGCNQFALWKTALSDAQCIQLSTL